ncbi:MAG: hypothetical protein JJ964_05775 [Rhizobiales bacterium]|nr:hypothetical protein [Hyphomicrobiales bacterium]
MTNENDEFDSVFNEETNLDLSGQEDGPRNEEHHVTHEPENSQETDEGELDQEKQTSEESTEKDDNPKTVPIAALHEERDARKALKSEVGELQAQLQEMAAAQQQLMQHLQTQPQQNTPEQHQFVDPLDDPRGYRDNITNQVQQMISPIQEQVQVNQIQNREAQSFYAAQAEFGQEVVQQAVKAAHDAGLSQDFRFNSNDPVGDCVKWHKQQLLIQETGGDLESYVSKIKAEAKAEALAEQQQNANAGQVSKGNIPPSLNKQTNAGGVEAFVSEDDFFNNIFK